MKEYIRQRALDIARHIVEHRCTVRDAAKAFDVSKSTVHKDVTQRLKDIDPAACEKVGEILQINLNERHLRGGMATKEKYSRKAERD